MAALSTCIKRLAKERERLPKDTADFWCNFKDDDLQHFEAYVVGPVDSVYAYKLVKLKFDIPDRYPLVPPMVKFVQHTGERIHPNLYVDGKVCLSILGTWPGDPWSFSMTCEGVLITIRSLLDSQPYLHEPHQRDNPEFNRYVRYNSWRWLLFDYLDREQDPAAKAFLQNYLKQHGAAMVAELRRQHAVDISTSSLSSPYNRKSSIKPAYGSLMEDLTKRVAECGGFATRELSCHAEGSRSESPKRKAHDDDLQ